MKPIWRQLIAISEMVGGIYGLGTIVMLLVGNGAKTTSYGQVLLLIVIFLFALFAGVTLWRDTRVGRVSSIICQLIQLPKLLWPDGGFMISYGFDFYCIHLVSPGLTINHAQFMGPSFYLLVNPGLWQEGLGVSLVSILSLRLLLKAGFAKEKKSRDLSASEAKSESPTHSQWKIPPWVVLVLVLAIICFALLSLSRQK